MLVGSASRKWQVPIHSGTCRLHSTSCWSIVQANIRNSGNRRKMLHMGVVKGTKTTLASYNSNSSSLYIFHAVWLVEEKIFHLNKVQRRNPSDLFFFRRPETLTFLTLFLTFWWPIWIYQDELLFLWILSICKLKHEFYIKPLGLYSVYEWFAGGYTSIKSTKIIFIPIYR